MLEKQPFVKCKSLRRVSSYVRTRGTKVTVASLATGIALVLFKIFVLDHPYGTDFGVGPQPFELVLHEMERKDAS